MCRVAYVAVLEPVASRACANGSLVPHKLFAAMFKTDADTFVDRMCGGDVDNVPRFWTSMLNHPSLVDHPTLAVVDWCTTFIPMSMHGDDVAVSVVATSWSKTMECYSWGRVWAKAAPS